MACSKTLETVSNYTLSIHMSELSIPAIALPSWMKAAARCGFNVEPILAAEGIELDLIHLQDSRVPMAALDRVLERCITRAGDVHFPFVVGEIFAFEYLPDVETYLTTSASLRDAAKVLEWLPALVNPMIHARLDESGEHAMLELRAGVDLPTPERPYHAEMFFASILKFGRMLAGANAGFKALHFRHAPPSYADKYEPFFGLPVRFGQTCDALLYEPGALDAPLDCDFPTLHRQAEALVTQRVAQHRQQSLCDDVLTLLKRQPELLNGGLDAVADKLALGARTLQRRLRAENTQFAELVDQARYQLAKRMIGQARDFENIAEALHFSDRRSFTRAFKRWSGQTPRQYRAASK